MGFLDRAKSAAETAAAKAKEGVEEVQLRRELGQLYSQLGKEAFDLIEGGQLTNPQLEAVAAKIRELNEKQAAEEAAAASSDSAG